MNHADARAIVAACLGHRLGEALTPEAVSICAAIGYLESNYGGGWKGLGAGSNNWGAVQKGSWTGATFTATDTRPDSRGRSVTYQMEFRKYATPQEGCDDMIRAILRFPRVVSPLLRGDIPGVSSALRIHREWEPGGSRLGYYEGFGTSGADRERHHSASLWAGLIRANQEIDPRLPCLFRGWDTPPTLYWNRPGAIMWIDRLRSLLSLPLGGRYPKEEVAAFQVAEKITKDLHVGPTTWGRLFARSTDGTI